MSEEVRKKRPGTLQGQKSRCRNREWERGSREKTPVGLRTEGMGTMTEGNPVEDPEDVGRV